MGRTDHHHLFFPKRDYRTKQERKFRCLPCNIVELDVDIHRLLHVTSEPPRKPSGTQMNAAINRHEKGNCGCKRG